MWIEYITKDRLPTGIQIFIHYKSSGIGPLTLSTKDFNTKGKLTFGPFYCNVWVMIFQQHKMIEEWIQTSTHSLSLTELNGGIEVEIQ